MKRLLYIIFLLFVVLLTTDCAYYNTFHNAKKFYREAEKERKKREKTQVVELSPEEEEQLKKAGRTAQDTKNRASQQEMQNYQQAIERSSRVLEYFPNSRWFDDALMLIGKCFYYRRDYKKAMRKFDEILANYPESDFIPETRLLKARTYIGLEEFDTAEEQLRAISNDSDIPKKVREEAKYELGGLYFKKGNYELAAENFASSAKSADDKLIKAMAQYRLGDCLIRLERYDEAPAILRRAVKLAPNEDFQSQASLKLGQSYSLNGDYDRAIKTFRTALSKEFDEKRIPRLKLELAKNLQLSGDLSEAIKWYENIIEEHKRTDASARSYFALGEIQEYLVGDYEKAKENYDLVRSEFSNSLIAPIAQERSDNIKTLKELQDDIARLEGRYVEADSLDSDEAGEDQDRRDDGPINLSMDGMWVNYTGRDRPPPISLRELTDTDLARQAVLQDRIAASGDSTKIDSSMMQPAKLDSAALAKREAEEAKQKEYDLSAKYLALGEVLLFAFDKPDSAIKYYQVVVEKHVDSTHIARALYSLSYVFREFKADTVLADTVLAELIDIFPESNHAEGARRILGLPLTSDKVDSAKIVYNQGEDAFYKFNNIDRAFELWDEVVEKYPHSEYAHKATYAKAWHMEHTLYDMDDAITLYQTLVDSFPESPYVAQVKPKLAAVDNVRKQEEARQKAIADSLAALEAAKQDSLGAIAATDSLGTATDSTAIALPDSLGNEPTTVVDSTTIESHVDSTDTTMSEPRIDLNPDNPEQGNEPDERPEPADRPEERLPDRPPQDQNNREIKNPDDEKLPPDGRETNIEKQPQSAPEIK